MRALPDWWNELIEWFRATRSNRLPPNMAHAWRVNRYADRVCNGGLADFLSTNRREIPLFVESLGVVASAPHAQILSDAIAFRSESRVKHRLPKTASVPKGVAYDCLFREWSDQKTQELLAELFPDCPSTLYPAILKAASDEVAALAGWERLNVRFYDHEHLLRLDISDYSQRHFNEWKQ